MAALLYIALFFCIPTQIIILESGWVTEVSELNNLIFHLTEYLLLLLLPYI
jgi:hypothetical protein